MHSFIFRELPLPVRVAMVTDIGATLRIDRKIDRVCAKRIPSSFETFHDKLEFFFSGLGSSRVT